MNARAVEQLLGAKLVESSALSGGDVNEAFMATLADGRRVFVKANPAAPADMFAREAEGLRWLEEAGALRVPRVLGVGRDVLVLEFLAPATRAANFDETLGAGLAALHRRGPKTFGLAYDNYIGTLKQTNAAAANRREVPGALAVMDDEPSAAETFATSDWATFYRDYRLAPLIVRARQHFDARAHRIFDVLLDRLPDLVGDPEPPARLHGDLWGGNLHVDEAGQPCLIDPAVYGGHREMDLAMMRLFGGFSERVFDAYAAAFPLSDGALERTSLYQLYPLLVHVNLFGASYAQRAIQAAKAYL